MDFGRWFKHLFMTRRGLHRAFPPATLDAIEDAITRAEQRHGGEIRVAVEAALEPAELWAGTAPRARALEIFAGLGVWDTEANNGVLVYILLADHDVEVVADRGFNGLVSSAEWSAVCDRMEERFRAGDFAAGTVAGVEAIAELIGRHYPLGEAGRQRNELPNRPTFL
jgi:uncharacterized membrane protein